MASISRELDVILASDVSGSMGGKKLKDSKQAQLAFMESIPLSTSRIGLVTFGGERANLLQPLTSKSKWIKSALDRLSAYGNTPLFAGLSVSYRQLKGDSLGRSLFQILVSLFTQDGDQDQNGDKKDRIIVLSSDGKANAGPGPSRILALGRRIKAEDIRIITIAIGNDADRKLLEELASSPGDFHVAKFSSELSGLYKEVAAGLRPVN